MILSDREIQAALESKQIQIAPVPERELWSSTAVDLTLDAVLLRWKTPGRQPTGQEAGPHPVWPKEEGFNINEMMEDSKYAEKISISEEQYKFMPQSFILGYTHQKIYLPHTSRIAAGVEGKSSLARLGVGVHVTAPTIHAGFGFNKRQPANFGLPIQLEIFNLGPFAVHLAVGMPICQLILEEVREVPNKGYRGQFAAQETFKVTES